MIKSGAVCHGMISALSVLKVIDLLYQKHNPKREYGESLSGNVDWDQKNFEDDIIPACAAIFIHNLSIDYFAKEKIDAKKAPLAFLLKLSDSLQDWERPSKKNLNGHSSAMYDISIENDKLIFNIQNDDSNDSIEKEVYSSLIRDSIRIFSLRT